MVWAGRNQMSEMRQEEAGTLSLFARPGPKFSCSQAPTLHEAQTHHPAMYGTKVPTNLGTLELLQEHKWLQPLEQSIQSWQYLKVSR